MATRQRLSHKGQALSADTVIINFAIHGELIWRRVAREWRVRPDGSRLSFTIWRGDCVVCGESFEIETFGRDQFSVTTCPRHRLSRAERGRLFQGDDERRRRVFEKIKAEKLALTP